MQNRSPREYPDWHRLVPRRFLEEVYRSPEDWVFYHNVDWESFLLYGLILHHKDYLIEGGAPEWFSAYVDRMEVLPFDCHNEDIVLVFEKDGWMKNTLVFHLEDRVTEGGTVYNMESRLLAHPEFWQGCEAPGRGACPQSVWEPFVVKHMERLRYGTTWDPVKK